MSRTPVGPVFDGELAVVTRWNELAAGNYGAWEHSDVMRRRRAAEAALPK